MGKSTARWGLFFLSWLVWAELVGAQEPRPVGGPVTREDFEDFRREVLDAIKKLPQQSAAADSASHPEYATKADFRALAKVLQDQVNADRDILNAIFTRDSQGQAILALRNSMSSQQFQQDLSTAVRETMQRRGELIIENNMPSWHQLRVGVESVWVAPYSKRMVPVDVGTVSVELVGYEAPKNWHVGPPKFEQRVSIDPRSTPRVIFEPIVWWR